MTGAALAPAEHDLARPLASLPAITLTDLNASAALLSRVDRKYFVPRRVFAAMIAEFAAELRVLQIDGRREFGYHSVYFDSPDFVYFRDHVQGRRHRYKVRTRTYLDSGDCMLEVKAKGHRGRTVKHRLPYEAETRAMLTADALAEIERRTASRADPALLQPVLVTDYQRSTLVHAAAGQRVTWDSMLRFASDDATVQGPDDVLLETKSSGGAGPVDRWLLQAGVREHSVSKYCVAAGLLYPGLRANRWHRTMRRYFAGEATRP